MALIDNVKLKSKNVKADIVTWKDLSEEEQHKARIALREEWEKDFDLDCLFGIEAQPGFRTADIIVCVLVGISIVISLVA